jgi:hypothetical protein
MGRANHSGKASTVSKNKSRNQQIKRPSVAQIVFLVLTIIIILSFVLTLFIQV